MLTQLALRALAGLQALVNRTRDEDGQTLAEYSLIVTVIAVGVVLLAIITFRGALAGAFNAATGCLDGAC